MPERDYLSYGTPGHYRHATFMLLHSVFMNEILGQKHVYYGNVSWEGDRNIFGGFIALNNLTAESLQGSQYLLKRADIVLDEGDTILRVDNNFLDALQDDPFVTDMVAQFKDLYQAHDHFECVARRAC